MQMLQFGAFYEGARGAPSPCAWEGIVGFGKGNLERKVLKWDCCIPFAHFQFPEGMVEYIKQRRFLERFCTYLTNVFVQMDLKSGVVRRHADLNKEGNQSMKTKKTYRMLAVLLAVVMVFGALPVTGNGQIRRRRWICGDE
ncbi:MAG: hypothetical protein ACLU9S_08570 [Oscillospiraceae bacterium]